MSTPWPSTLPQRPLPFDYEEEEADNSIKQNMDVGPPKSRPRTTSRGPTLSLVFVFTRSQLSTFKTFYRTTLGYGSLPYEWEHPETHQTADFVFVEKPVYKFHGGTTEATELWRCSFKAYQKS